MTDIKQYIPKIKEPIKAIEISASNIAEIENFYKTQFSIGEFIILADEEERADNVVKFPGAVWSNESFHANFEEYL